MTNFILDEKKFVEDFLLKKNNNYMQISSNYLTKLVTRYCIQYKNMTDTNLLEAEVFNIIQEAETNHKQDYILSKFISKVVIKELENMKPLREFEYIPVYDTDIALIEKCKKDRERKFLFTCMVLSKYYGSEWINVPYKDIFKLSNISLSNKERLKFIGGMYDNNYIGISYSNTNNSLRIPSAEKGELVMKIRNFDNLGNKLLAHLKDGYKTCVGIKPDGSICGKLIKVTNNRMKYCKECAKFMDSINKRERMETLRNSNL